MFLFGARQNKMNDDYYMVYLRSQRDKYKTEVDNLTNDIKTATTYYNNIIRDYAEKERMESRIWSLTQHYNDAKEQYEWYCSEIGKECHTLVIQELKLIKTDS